MDQKNTSSQAQKKYIFSTAKQGDNIRAPTEIKQKVVHDYEELN